MGKMNAAEPEAKCSYCGAPLEEGDLCGTCEDVLGYNRPLSALIEELIDGKMWLAQKFGFANQVALQRREERLEKLAAEIDRRFPNVR